MPSEFRPSIIAHPDLESKFPNLINTDWFIKSPRDGRYKCVSWAACRTNVIWWPVDAFPVPPPDAYWPDGVPRNETVDAFIQAFATLGYEQCNDSTFEFGFQKVAIYVGNDELVRHLSRQDFCGRGWLSKLGGLEDIFHPDLENVADSPSLPPEYSYGQVKIILKRNWWIALINLCVFRCSFAAFKFWVYRVVNRIRE